MLEDMDGEGGKEERRGLLEGGREEGEGGRFLGRGGELISF